MSQGAEVINLEERRVKADLDDGYLKLSNTIVQALITTHLSGNETQVLFAVISKTYGYNKKADWIAGSQIAALTGLKKERVSEALNKLVGRQILIKTGREIGPNPVVSEWLESIKLRKSVTAKVTEKRNPELRKSVTGVTEKRNKSYGKAETQKTKNNTTKDTTTKNRGLDLSGLPGWLPENTAVDFIAHRKAIKKPITQQALALLINKLLIFRDKGHDPVAILNESIMNGWQGVFEPKGQGGFGGGINRQQALESRNAQAVAEFAGHAQPVTGNTFDGEAF